MSELAIQENQWSSFRLNLKTWTRIANGLSSSLRPISAQLSGRWNSLLTQSFGFIQFFSWLDEACLHQGGQSALFTLPVHVNIIQKHADRHTRDNVWPNVWASDGPVKLTHEVVTHHKVQEHAIFSFTSILLHMLFLILGLLLVSWPLVPSCWIFRS